MSDNSLHDLNGRYGVLAVNGTDAERLLQGQLSCDVARLQDGDAVLGSFCTPQGRMIADFHCARLGAARWLLRMRADVLPACLAALSKYAVFYQLELRDDSAEWRLWGLHGPDAAELARADDAAVRAALDDDCWECWWPVGEDAAALARWRESAAEAAPSAWTLQAIRSGRAEVCAATSELFIPQMLDLDRRGGISFDKGCYTGQEIIARAHYRGALKRRLHRATAPALAAEGSPVRKMGSGKNVGHVALAAAADGDGACELLLVAGQISGGPLAVTGPAGQDAELGALAPVGDAATEAR